MEKKIPIRSWAIQPIAVSPRLFRGLDNCAIDIKTAMPRNQIVASASLHGNLSPLVMPIADSTPDSWGREIMRAANGGRAMNDFEYLIGVDDFLRSGALRFYDSDMPDAFPLAQPRNGERAFSIPRLIELEAMIYEARAFEADPAHYRENRAQLPLPDRYCLMLQARQAVRDQKSMCVMRTRLSGSRSCQRPAINTIWHAPKYSRFVSQTK